MTATEKYHAVLEGKLSEAEFVRQMRQSFPQFLSQWNGFKDSVSILKNRQMIFEKKETPKKDITALADNFPLNVIERGIDIELETSGIDSTGSVSKDDYIKAKHKVISNLQKDANHYINLMSGESNKVDKHDKMKETKRGAKDADTFNAMKKATLKEDVDPTLDPYEDKKEIVRQVIDLVKREKSVPTSVAVDFIKTHYEDILNLRDDQAILDEFDEFVSVNYEGPSDMDEKKLNEEGVEDANYKMGEAFKRYGIDLTRDVIVVEMDGGTPQYGGGKLDIEPAEPAMLVAKRLEQHRLDTILDYESEGSNGDFPVTYEDGFYGDYTPEGTEHKLTYSEDGGTMWDIFQAPSGVSEKEGMDAAQMDAIKNYTPGSMDERPHEYKPGDMFSTDFDYEGMLKAGLKVRINTPIETMQAIYDSFEDVNYHRENSHLGDVIDAVEGGNKEVALNALKKFRREIKETLSGIFEGTFPIRERDEDYVPKRRGALEERVGGLQEFISLIEDRAAENDTTEAEEAEEVVYAIGDHYNFGVDIMHASNEAKGKDHDGDGDVDGDDYMAAKDKAIKNAMKENVKAIITKVLEEGTLNEAATNQLAKFAEDYAGFEGMKGAILDLQNIVSDIEAYYDKTRDKIQKVYNTLGEIRNEEGLKVGGFLAPAIESAFTKDLRPVTKQGFTKGLDQPKVRVISQKDIDAHNSGERPLGETDQAPKQSVFTPNI